MAASPDEVRDIATADDLLRRLTALDAAGDLAGQASLFEQVAFRIDVVHFWILHRMQRVYADLGRGDLAFLVAALAERLGQEPGALFPLRREMFVHHRERGEAEAAMAVFLRHAAGTPERPIADRWEVEPLARAIGLSLDGEPVAPSPGARRDHVLAPEAVWTPQSPPCAGARLPVELARMSAPLLRHATIVAELPDAEVFIRHDSLASVDRDGALHVDLSLGPFPKLLRDRVERDDGAERLELDEAVVLLDPFPPPNLCHFLLDQIPRLGLYERAGAALGRASVIGPRLRAPFQQEIAARVTIGPWLSTDRVARVRVRRLWVSTECREVQHPAQLGAPWTIAWLRDMLEAPTAPGTRLLFVSRADSPTRRLVNEDALLPALRARGYEVIVPGRMSYDEQLAAFRQASHVVACHGAALAHLAACAPGTHVLEMFHPLYGTWAYAMLAQQAGLRYAALVGRDGASDAPALNDPEASGPGRGRFGDRGLRIDQAELEAWLDAAA